MIATMPACDCATASPKCVEWGQTCEKDTQIFHKEIPNQFQLREISMQGYKSVCKTDQRIHLVVFLILEFIDQVLYG